MYRCHASGVINLQTRALEGQQAMGAYHSLDQGWLRVTAGVPHVNDERDPAVMQDRLEAKRGQKKKSRKRSTGGTGRTRPNSMVLIMRSCFEYYELFAQ
jgi:hypothetical protein